jgi:hypothetical protein
MYPEKVAGLVITGSSGLYEGAMEIAKRRLNIKHKAEDVFTTQNSYTYSC